MARARWVSSSGLDEELGAEVRPEALGDMAAALDGISPGEGRRFESLIDTVTTTFGLVEVALDELEAAKARTPLMSPVLHRCFIMLQPTSVLRGKSPDLYRRHCRELLDRVVAGEDHREMTSAEVCGLLCDLSLMAPLAHDSAALYMTHFRRIFPDKAVDDEHLYRGSYKGSLEELERKIRRRFRNSFERSGPTEEEKRG